MKEIRALTTLRGVAALWVFLFHLDLERPILPPMLRDGLAIGRGYIAVDLFFALSGFVLALNHRRDFLERPFANAYQAFLLRRVARVMPLNAAIVCVLTAAAWLAPGLAGGSFAAARHGWTVVANLFLVQDWDIAPSIDTPSWSVSVEMALYLAFPLLIALAWSRRVWLLIALGCAASLWWLARTGHGSVSQGSALGDLVRGASSFFFGLLACRAFLGGRVGAIAGRVDLAVLALFWGAILLAANDVIPILICPLLILALAGGCGRVARILTSDIPHYLGDISYAVYLVHACVLGGLNLLAIRQDWLYAVAALGLTLAISAAANRWIERPARRLITGHQPSRL